MEILSPASYLTSSKLLVQESKGTKWTAAENKMFENALAVYDKDTPDRWHKVAAMIPGKTVEDVIRQYEELEVDVSQIEAGLIPIPGYTTSQFTLEWVNGNGYDGFKQTYGFAGKRPASARPVEQERKKGVPWTEEEHKLFLMGLKKYGKGDWRNISRNFVVTRTPTQVASHAQKYFIRQLSGGKDKRRASIHDITTVNLTENEAASLDSKKAAPARPPSEQHTQPSNPTAVPLTHFQWNGAPPAAAAAFNPTSAAMFMPPSYGVNVNPFGLKMQGPGLHRGAVQEPYLGGPQNMVFQMPAAQHYPHG